MIKPYQRILSLVCSDCGYDCVYCDVENTAKRIVSDVREETMNDVAEFVIENFAPLFTKEELVQHFKDYIVYVKGKE